MTVGMAMEAGSSPLKCGDWEGGEKRDNGEKRVKKKDEKDGDDGNKEEGNKENKCINQRGFIQKKRGMDKNGIRRKKVE